MLGERHRELLALLRAADSALSGDEIAAQLHVSTRSVRQYVSDVNKAANAEIVVTSHRGYRLDNDAFERFDSGRKRRRPRGDGPTERMYAVVSNLLRNPGGVEARDLAEAVHVSPATIEADLVRAREVLAEFDLRIVRERGLIRIEGPESQRRRVLRQILIDSARGEYPPVMEDVFGHYRDRDVRLLKFTIAEALRSNRLRVNEYALNDLVLHVLIAVDRVREGHRMSTTDVDAEPPAPVQSAVNQIADHLETSFAVRLTPAEHDYLGLLLEVKTTSRETRALSAPALTDDHHFQLVRSIAEDLADRYLIDVSDDAFLLSLSLHVRSLIQRASAGGKAHNPVAASFKWAHPLIHELAVFVAHELERREGISIDDDEIAFLSFHIGSLLLRSPHTADHVTIVCVTPGYHDVAALMGERLSRALPSYAVISDIVTTLTDDFSHLECDLVVSSVRLPGEALPPTVTVTPLPTDAEIAQVVETVRKIRERKARQRLRTNLVELLDPLFYHRVASVESREQALELMTATLVAEGVVNAGYLDDVLEREHLSSTAFGSLAVPHSLRLDANRSTISILVTDTPIHWADARVRLIVMLVLSPTGRPLFNRVLDEFVRVLAEPANVEELIRHGDTYLDFVDTLFGVLDKP